ncbi:2,4-dihydroxyhept-2-ene-1,7-dioic acid aldolase [Rhodovulum sp. PH10]|uniref:HpcH/HpaI aldolase family protein n=1 Tax=Rhodovulum sp. PH10 TaxID=1187851 RepID=UPI00027C268B|nr:aldolase/citrate lyase family protein [Rhodovulum sp. PH10]EJW11362.1 2,4-dihydroxyhept-2-ene-1,7-dioic acid aldolase [Rhodovulum sp. PH10]
MELPINHFKRALTERQQIGLWSTLRSNMLAELFACCGYDWILIDTEHSPNEVPDIVAQLQAMSAYPTSAVVRPAWSDMILVKRLLDAGAQTLLFPCIQSAQEAREAVSFVRYPPRGVRGVAAGTRAGSFGTNPHYLANAEKELCVLVQIETGEGLKNLEEIAAVDGVDGVFIGPADLGASLGHLGDSQHPDVQSAVDDAFARLRRLNKPAGYLTTNAQEAARRVAAGVEFIAVATDTSIITKGAVSALAQAREAARG